MKSPRFIAGVAWSIVNAGAGVLLPLATFTVFAHLVPPILIGFAILLHGLTLHPVAKAAVLTLLAVIGSFAASAFVLRKSPLRRII